MVAGCARAGVPVVAFHRPVRFIEITEAVHGAVVNAQFALLARGEEIHRRFTELILQGRGVPEILAELCAAVGNPVVLEDAGGSLVYYVSGPPGDDLALSAWADVHRAEDRGEAAEGVFAVDVRLLDSSLGAAAGARRWRSRSTTSTAWPSSARRWPWRSTCSAQQHDEQLRARSRGAFLSDLADGRVEEADARRRAEALGLSAHRPRRAAAGGRHLAAPAFARGRARGDSPGEARVADGITWTRLSGDLRAALSSTGFAVLLGPRDVDLLILLALGSRGYDAALAEHVAHLFHGALDRHGLGPGGRRAGDRRRRRTRGSRRGRALRRVRRSAGAATALPVARWHDARRPGVADLLHDLRDTPELEAFVEEQLGPLLARRARRARGRCWRRSRPTWRRAGARPRRRGRCTWSASRCTCGCAGSRRRSASRSTTRTSCSACTWRSARCASAAGLTVRRAGPAAPERDVPPIAGAPWGEGEHGSA